MFAAANHLKTAVHVIERPEFWFSFAAMLIRRSILLITLSASEKLSKFYGSLKNILLVGHFM
jgi:ribosomal protein S19E (S16A)